MNKDLRAGTLCIIGASCLWLVLPPGRSPIGLPEAAYLFVGSLFIGRYILGDKKSE